MTSHQESISALPTKTFFVEMLVKDVSLPSAIMDLIDNSIDGALRLRGSDSLEGLWVELTLGSDEFVIKDNCGGIPLDTARNYAFRFGRESDAPKVDNSVGLFGVGMKRAVFKIGGAFDVESNSERDSFLLAVNVEKWTNEVEWRFDMVTQEHAETVPESDRGTTITVSGIYEGVSSQFTTPLFVSRLEEEIATRLQLFLDRGLSVRVGGRLLKGSVQLFAYIQGRLHPAFEEIHKNGVSVRLYSGVGEPGPQSRTDAGWYVYCNGRMVVKADQTDLTGWGTLGTSRIPRYHHQFARFRGFAFFDSRISSELPWNTTKDGLDVEHELYRTVKLRMASHMRPVISFLNRIDKELEADSDKRVLTNMLDVAEYAPATSLPASVLASEFFSRPPHNWLSCQRTQVFHFAVQERL